LLSVRNSFKATWKYANMPEVDAILAFLDNQIAWYHRAALRQMVLYLTLKVVELVCASLVPLLVLLSSPDFPGLKYAAAGIGVVVVICQGLLALTQCHENWLRWRSTWHALRVERMLFISKVGKYAAEDKAAAMLVKRIEALVSQEFAGWYSKEVRSGSQQGKTKKD